MLTLDNKLVNYKIVHTIIIVTGYQRDNNKLEFHEFIIQFSYGLHQPCCLRKYDLLQKVTSDNNRIIHSTDITAIRITILFALSCIYMSFMLSYILAQFGTTAWSIPNCFGQTYFAHVTYYIW